VLLPHLHVCQTILMIKTIVEEGYWDQVFNGVYPLHPTKREYYQTEAKKRNIPAPNFSESDVKTVLKFVKSENFLIKKHAFYTSIYT